MSGTAAAIVVAWMNDAFSLFETRVDRCNLDERQENASRRMKR